VVIVLEIISVPLELDRPVGQLHPREDTRPAGDHVASPNGHNLADRRSAGDLGLRSARAARAADSVAELAALPDLGAVEDHGALDGAVRPDLDVAAQHHEAADPRAGGDPHTRLKPRGGGRPAEDLGARLDRHPALPHALLDGRLDVALDDVEGP